MSGIYAGIVTADDGGIRRNTNEIIKRSRSRGDKEPVTALIQGSEVDLNSRLLIYVENSREAGSKLRAQYAFIGTAQSQPAGSEEFGVMRSPSGRYICVFDGAIVGGSLSEMLDKHGFWIVSQLGGNFSALIFDMTTPDRIWFVNQAKPLYALYDALGRCLRVASQRRYFDGLYHPLRTPSPLELGPFSHGWIDSLGRSEITPLHMRSHSGTVLLSGGGLDTLVAAHTELPPPVTLLYVDYGALAAQREWNATQDIARSSGADWAGVDMSPFKHMMHSALTGFREVEKRPAPGVASEWVPGRNSLLMALALSYAESIGRGHIATGINMAAASAYPDNEEEWANKWQSLVPYSVGLLMLPPKILSPLAGLSKTGIVKLGQALGIPEVNIAMSWSCYEGGEKHCGECSSCRARRQAFITAKVKDPTDYAN